MIYFERTTSRSWSCDRSIQTNMPHPEFVAVEYSWDNPTFTGTLEVVVRRVVESRPYLEGYPFRIHGPGKPKRVESMQSGEGGGNTDGRSAALGTAEAT